MRTRTIAMALATFAFSTTAHAQWLTERTPGIPRSADGKPNLTAPAPRTLDGRKLPAAPNPSFMGSSVGRWEGDELVIESAGFMDSTWLDFGGHPHSEAMRLTERYRRVDFGHIQRRITLSDPQVFDKPITFSSDLALVPDTELLEYVCIETPPDRYHLSGSTGEVRVAPAILAKYVGDYDFEGPNPFNFRTLTLSLADGRLVADFDGKGRVPMVAISDTMFSPRLLGTYEFVSDEHGGVTHILAHCIAASSKIVRRRDATR